MATKPQTDTKDVQRLKRRLAREMELLEDAEHNLRVAQQRLTISASMVSFMNEAYDALLYTNVNYRECRVYKEPTNPLLDTTNRMTEAQAFKVLVSWLSRMRRDLNASIKRKAIKEVPKG